MRKAMSEDDICEYTVPFDDEHVRCDARESRESHGGRGVGGCEQRMEKNGSAEVVGDGFGFEYGQRRRGYQLTPIGDEDVQRAEDTHSCPGPPGL